MAFVLRFDETDTKRQNFAINQLAQGRSNAVGSFTLAASVTSTTVTAQNCGSGSFIFLMPKTANAAAALATLYIGTVANGSFTITHANNAQVDRSFGYVALG